MASNQTKQISLVLIFYALLCICHTVGPTKMWSNQHSFIIIESNGGLIHNVPCNKYVAWSQQIAIRRLFIAIAQTEWEYIIHFIDMYNIIQSFNTISYWCLLTSLMFLITIVICVVCSTSMYYGVCVYGTAMCVFVCGFGALLLGGIARSALIIPICAPWLLSLYSIVRWHRIRSVVVSLCSIELPRRVCSH